MEHSGEKLLMFKMKVLCDLEPIVHTDYRKLICNNGQRFADAELVILFIET